MAKRRMRGAHNMDCTAPLNPQSNASAVTEVVNAQAMFVIAERVNPEIIINLKESRSPKKPFASCPNIYITKKAEATIPSFATLYPWLSRRNGKRAAMLTRSMYAKVYMQKHMGNILDFTLEFAISGEERGDKL